MGGKFKKLGRVLFVVLVNLLLLLASAFLTVSLVPKYERLLHVFSNVTMSLVSSLMVIGFFLYFLIQSKTFKQFGIGIIAFLIPALIGGFYFINYSVSQPGEFKMLNVYDHDFRSTQAVLEVANYRGIAPLDVTIDKALYVDSASVRIDHGLFGLDVLSNVVKIPESADCSDYEIDSLNTNLSYLSIGNDLSFIRCFSEAIHYYSLGLNLEPLNGDLLYNRGLAYLTKEEYKEALHDFERAYYLKYIPNDWKQGNYSPAHDTAYYIAKFVEEMKKENYQEVPELFSNLKRIPDSEIYRRLITFCREKLNQK